MHRRNILQTAAAGIGIAVAGGVAAAKAVEPLKASGSPFITTRDGTNLYFKDWGSGRPVVFVHSWSANSDMWQYEMTPLSETARCIAYDRRGHGRSSQPGEGYDYDTLADDLACIMDTLDLRDAVLVGHSMGAGEIVRYLTRHGSARVSRIVLIAPVTPFILKTPDNPDGIPEDVFAAFRAQWLNDFPGWMTANASPFFVDSTSQGMRQWLLGQTYQCSLKAAIGCNIAFSRTDFRTELPRITVPTLVIHGDKDASAPIELTGRRTAALISGATLMIYEGAPHGIFVTHSAKLTADLAEFVRA